MDYDKRFKLQRQRASQDACGDVSVRWVTELEGWAAFRNLGSREFWEAAAVQQEGTVKMLARHHPVFDRADTRGWRVVGWDGRAYDIVQIDDTGHRHDEVCVRMVARDGDEEL